MDVGVTVALAAELKTWRRCSHQTQGQGLGSHALASHCPQPSLSGLTLAAVASGPSSLQEQPRGAGQSRGSGKPVGPGLSGSGMDLTYDKRHRKFERAVLPPAAGPPNKSRSARMAELRKVAFGKSTGKA